MASFFFLFCRGVEFMRYFLPLCAALLTLFAAASQAALPAREFNATLSALESKSGGRIGVAVVAADGKTLLSYRANERFAMCSTFKALLGAAILARVDAGRESLDRAISYKEAISSITRR
jgi:beta-lactamase class A